MPAWKFLPQVSLRTLFLTTALVAAATEAFIAARQHQAESRRVAFVMNFHEQLITSRQMKCRTHSERYLAYVERTINGEDDAFLPRTEKRRLRQLLSAERSRLSKV